MAATTSQFYFRFRFSWFRSSEKVEIYLHTKFRRDISIHGWDITTSGSWKQRSAVFEIYFRFRFLRLRHHRHVILHPPTKFRPNRTIRDGVTTSYPFSRWQPRHRNSISGFGFRNFAHLGRSKYTCVPNFGGISQSTAKILLFPVSENKLPPCLNFTPVPTFTFASPSACHSASAYQITSKWSYPQQSYDVISIFQDGDRQPDWIILRLLQTTREVQVVVSGWSSNFHSIGFIVSEILLFLCYKVFPA